MTNDGETNEQNDDNKIPSGQEKFTANIAEGGADKTNIGGDIVTNQEKGTSVILVMNCNDGDINQQKDGENVQVKDGDAIQIDADEMDYDYTVPKFVCEQCDVFFKTKYNLNRHQNSVHEKIRPFSCPVCNKGFTQKGNMQRHEKMIHRQNPEM